jgi:hypothetical protein
VSLPAPPAIASAPAPPSRRFAPVLPVSTLSSALPVPLMSAVPVRTRFSTLAPSAWLIELSTVSVPWLASFAHRVAGVVDDIGVVAGAARHRVGPGAAVEAVRPGVAGQHVVERVAGAVDVGGAGQDQVLDIGAERVAERALDRVGALVRELAHRVAGVVDDIGVVAGAARHRVGPGAAVEPVRPAVAGERVVERVASAVDVGGPGQDQVLDMGAERVAERALDRVGALVRELAHRVAGVVDDIGVVAGAARHRVGPGAAIEPVRPAVAGERVVERVAGAVDVGGPGQDQVLDIGAERVGERALDRVGALVHQFDHRVAGVVDDIGVVAGAARHRVGPGAAVEAVRSAVAGQHVVERVAGAVDVGGAGQDQVLDIGAERVADRALDRVSALVHQLRHRVAGVVDDIGVVAGAARHRVGPGAAVEAVRPAVAGERVVERVAGAVDVGGPVRTRFSTLAPSAWLIELSTVSVPWFTSSTTVSPALSTT